MAFPTITEKIGYTSCGQRAWGEFEFEVPLTPMNFQLMAEPAEPQLDSALEDEIWLEARKFLDNRET